MNDPSPLVRLARLPGFRALAWNGDWLYASKGYQLFRTRPRDVSQELQWQFVAKFRAPWRRTLSVHNRLTTRLFRDGFHALAVLPSGGLVAAVPGAILTLRPNETEFHVSHPIGRGTRPLHITVVPDGTIYWGEYFDNPLREQVHIYASRDHGSTWNIAQTFPKGAIRHVHNIVHDPWAKCLWIFTGDYGEECRILKAPCDLSCIENVLQGNQQARAVAAIPTESAIYFASDTPLESNFIYRLDRQGVLSQVAPISSSSIYGCRVGRRVFFSTMVEPSKANPDQSVRIYRGGPQDAWTPVLAWKKDRWPMHFFQYGNALLPDGDNQTSCLALTTIAVKGEDITTSIYACP